MSYNSLNMTEERINIAPLARQLRNEGLSDNLRTTSDTSYSSFLQGGDFYIDNKPEVYALTAVLIDRIIGRAHSAREQRQPFGLVYFPIGPQYGGYVLSPDDIDSEHPFHTLQMAFFGTLVAAQADEMEEIENGTAPENIRRVYKRLIDVVSPVMPIRTEFGLQSGIDFAAVVMSASAEIIPRLQGDTNAKKLTEIARNSIPLIVRLAAGNRQHNIRGLDALTTAESRDNHYPEFRSDCFEVRDVGATTQLVLSEGGIQRLKDFGIDDLRVGDSPTIGCPALVNFGEGSAVNLLWNWYVDVANDIYPSLTNKEYGTT